MPAKTPTTKKGLSTALKKAKARLTKLAEAAKERRAARKPKVYSQASWKGATPKRLGVYYIRIMSDEQQVGGFGPYATVRAAASDAKNILRLNIGPGHKIVETGPVVPVIRSDERVKLYLHPESYSAQVAGKGIVSAQIIEIAGNDERLKSGDDNDLGTFGVKYNPRRAYEVEVMLRSKRTGVVKTRVVRVQSSSREAAAAAVRSKYQAAGTLYDIGFVREALAANPRRRNGAKKVADPYVFVEGRTPDGGYFGSNYRKSQLPALYVALRAAGVHRVTLDETTDVDLTSAKSNPLVAFKTRSGRTISFDAKRRNPAYGGGMDESKPVVVEGVKGMKSTPFRKTFRNFAAYLKWSDSEAAGNYSVSHVYNVHRNPRLSVEGEDRYEFTHGKRPSGRGSWMFADVPSIDFRSPGYEAHLIQVPGLSTYTEAKKYAISIAADRGFKRLYVLT